MDQQTLSLTIIAAAQLLGCLLLIVATLVVLPKIGSLLTSLNETLAELKRTLKSADSLVRDVQDKNIMLKLAGTLDNARSAVGRIDPLAAQLEQTMGEVRSLLDDATQTSQSARARIDDLATMQKDITSLSSSLADISSDLNDRELSKRITNLLSDVSLLTADIGILTENANSYLEKGRPLVSNVADVVNSARQRVSGVSRAVAGVRQSIGAQGGKDGEGT
jgi:uncharacterized protein YoxC